MTFEAYVASLDAARPPPDLGLALRALWFDANGRPESALRAARSDDSHTGKRVRAYLARKAGDVHEARLWYWRAGASPWPGPAQGEWEDIARTVLLEGPVMNAYG